MKSTTIKDGYGITVGFASAPTLHLIIDPTSITPPGIEGGDAIDTTTHTNADVRTKSPRSLKEIADGGFTAAYDPDAWDNLMALINVNNLITFTYPDGATVAAWGYLKSFIEGELVEGEMPDGEGEIVFTNENAAGAETLPVYVSGS